MKNKIYAILLLLSFLVVLSHELINHHHHEAKAIDLSVIHNRLEADDHHHGDNNHHRDDAENENSQKESDKNHNHPFPVHHHFSATTDFVTTRTNLQESNQLNKISTLFLVAVIFQADFFEPPCLSINPFKDKSFLISSIYYPAANALRGPPSIV